MIINRFRSVLWGVQRRKKYSVADPPRKRSRSKPMVTIPASALYLRDIFGGDFTEKDSEPVVGTTMVELVKNDPERIALTIINLGAANVLIAPDNKVSTTRGILLTASGGAVSMDVRSDATLPSRAWYAISASAGNDVYVLEIRRYAVFPT